MGASKFRFPKSSCCVGKQTGCAKRSLFDGKVNIWRRAFFDFQNRFCEKCIHFHSKAINQVYKLIWRTCQIGYLLEGLGNYTVERCSRNFQVFVFQLVPQQAELSRIFSNFLPWYKCLIWQNMMIFKNSSPQCRIVKALKMVRIWQVLQIGLCTWFIAFEWKCMHFSQNRFWKSKNARSDIWTLPPKSDRFAHLVCFPMQQGRFLFIKNDAAVPSETVKSSKVGQNDARFPTAQRHFVWYYPKIYYVSRVVSRLGTLLEPLLRDLLSAERDIFNLTNF
jgi:hypothetical protein